MSLWKQGNTSKADVRSEAIGLGTVGGDHVVPFSIGGGGISSFVDNEDPRVVPASYSSLGGDGSATLTYNRSASFDLQGTTLIFTEQYTGARFTFKGSTIGVLSRTFPGSSPFRVYIDGQLTAGRVFVFASLDSATYGPTTPLSSSATTITVDDTTNFDSSGTILIGDEQITYSGKTATTFTGCTRGANGSTAAEHAWTEIVYKWTYDVPLSTGAALGSNFDFSSKQLVYYNPYLSDGEHYIDVVMVDKADDFVGFNFILDGFIIGPVVGARQIYHTIGTTTLTSTTYGNSNASGYVDLGTFSTRKDVTIIGILGLNQISPSPISGSAKFQLQPYNYSTVTNLGRIGFEMTNGPANSAWTVQIIWSYIGESI